MGGLAPATNIKCYALKVMYEKQCFPWHVEGDLTVEALTGGNYTFTGRWGKVDTAKPVLYAGYCEPEPPGSFLGQLESLLRHFQNKDEERYPQDPTERRTALNRWMTMLTMQPKLYSEAVKEYAKLDL